MKTRSLLSFILVILVLTSLVTSSAVDKDENLSPNGPDRYIGVSQMSVSLSIDSTGNASYSGYVNLHNGYTATATLSLQQYQSGGWGFFDSSSATGHSIIAIARTRCVESGYSYRAKMTAVVYDSNGNYVETVTAISSTVYY